MDCLSIRRTAQSVSAVAEPMRSAWPARDPSPKKSPSPNMPIVASLPVVEITVSLLFPVWILNTASLGSPCAKMVCPLANKMNFLPLPMVARNEWESKARFFLATTLGALALCCILDAGSVGVWRAIFHFAREPLGWRAGDIDTSFRLKQRYLYFTSSWTAQTRNLRPSMRRMIPNHEIRIEEIVPMAYPTINTEQYCSDLLNPHLVTSLLTSCAATSASDLCASVTQHQPEKSAQRQQK